MSRTAIDAVTWYWDDYQCPEAVGPLTQSLYPYIFQAFTLASRLVERTPPATMRFRFDHGYLYLDFNRGGAMTEAGRRAWQGAPARWHAEWLPEIKANLARLASIDLPALTGAELSGVLHNALGVVARHWGLHLIHGAAQFAVLHFVDWCAEHLSGDDGLHLLQGQSNLSVESGHALWQLSQLVTPAMVPALQTHDLAGLPAAFREALDQYLEQFGRHTARFCDLGSPTWLEEPGPVLDLILGYVTGRTADPLIEVARLAAEREALTARARERLAPAERAEFEALLATALLAHPLLEDHALWIEVQTIGVLRLVCAEFGRRMAAEGAIPTPADVAFLRLGELHDWGAGLTRPELAELIAARKAEHLANLQWQPTPWIGLAPEEDEPEERPTAPPTSLSGIAAVPGVVQGRARVVSTMAEAKSLQRGEILVAPWIHPDWMPLFALAGALVTDQGGALSHAAVVAREYGLTAVVGTGKATKVFETGQIIEVNGATGTVTLVLGAE